MTDNIQKHEVFDVQPRSGVSTSPQNDWVTAQQTSVTQDFRPSITVDDQRRTEIVNLVNLDDSIKSMTTRSAKPNIGFQKPSRTEICHSVDEPELNNESYRKTNEEMSRIEAIWKTSRMLPPSSNEHPTMKRKKKSRSNIENPKELAHATSDLDLKARMERLDRENQQLREALRTTQSYKNARKACTQILDAVPNRVDDSSMDKLGSPLRPILQESTDQEVNDIHNANNRGTDDHMLTAITNGPKRRLSNPMVNSPKRAKTTHPEPMSKPSEKDALETTLTPHLRSELDRSAKATQMNDQSGVSIEPRVPVQEFRGSSDRTESQQDSERKPGSSTGLRSVSYSD